MFTIVSSNRLGVFGIWSAGFYNNEGYRSLKKYPPHRIMEIGDEYLRDATEYEIKEMISLTRGGFTSPLYGVKTPLERTAKACLVGLVSKTIEKRLQNSLKAKSISEVVNTKEEHLQVAVMLMWIASIVNSKDRVNAAMANRQRLIDELKEVEKFLGIGGRIGK